MGILLFIIGALLGAIGTYWYASKTISDLTEKNLDKALTVKHKGKAKARFKLLFEKAK